MYIHIALKTFEQWEKTFCKIIEETFKLWIKFQMSFKILERNLR